MDRPGRWRNLHLASHQIRTRSLSLRQRSVSYFCAQYALDSLVPQSRSEDMTPRTTPCHAGIRFPLPFTLWPRHAQSRDTNESAGFVIPMALDNRAHQPIFIPDDAMFIMRCSTGTILKTSNGTPGHRFYRGIFQTIRIGIMGILKRSRLASARCLGSIRMLVGRRLHAINGAAEVWRTYCQPNRAQIP